MEYHHHDRQYRKATMNDRITLGSIPGRYTVQWSPSNHLIAIVMAGFWEDEDVVAFSDALNRAVTAARRATFDLIADLSDLLAQSQAVVTLQGDVVANLVSAGMRHFVIVGAAPLLTMQVRRAAAPLVPIFAVDLGEGLRLLADA